MKRGEQAPFDYRQAQKEIGCGPGDDACALCEAGFDVITDACTVSKKE